MAGNWALPTTHQKNTRASANKQNKFSSFIDMQNFNSKRADPAFLSKSL